MTSLDAQMRRVRPLADIALKTSAVTWFFVAITGQWLFVTYIAVH